MPLDPRTPVLVGAAALQQRCDDPRDALEPLELMSRALEAAADDAGNRDLLAKADSIRAPRGFWAYSDPCRLMAERFGAHGARTLVAEIGVLQTTLFGDTARAIAAGELDVALVAGADCKYRSLREIITGTPAAITEQTGVEPDLVLRPHAEIIPEIEMRLDVVMPVKQYAMIENALRRADGLDLAAHHRQVAQLWAGMSEVAAANPDAWKREAVSADELAQPSERNPLVAFPYTKLHNSNWNVDQAAGLIFCSLEAARAAGISEEKWVFPLSVVDSNHMLPLSLRAEPHRVPGARIAGHRALQRAGTTVGELGHIELYSCFPAAVRAFAREIGIGADRPVTETGGMAFAGGPLNNFVLQALVKMAHVLRDDPGSTGLVSAVSGFLTKQGVSVWSTRAGDAAFAYEDVAEQTGRETRSVELAEDWSGDAEIATYTVECEKGEPTRGIALCDVAGGRRTLAETRDPELVLAMTREEFCGRGARVGPAGQLASVGELR